jgi:hypothetical protein
MRSQTRSAASTPAGSFRECHQGLSELDQAGLPEWTQLDVRLAWQTGFRFELCGC